MIRNSTLKKAADFRKERTTGAAGKTGAEKLLN
jgi:hypothetical protein